MIELKDLLGKFENLLVGETIKQRALQDVLHSVAGVSVKKEDIKIEGSTVYLNIKPIYKSEIFLKRGEIARALAQSLGAKAPKDIR